MLSCWIESAPRGRQGGPIRAGMWGTVVVASHPVVAHAEIWIELTVDDGLFGRLPATWLENRGVNSLWHVPLPPQSVGARLRYRAVIQASGEVGETSYQDLTIRPNLPDRTDAVEPAVDGLVGNRHLSARIDARGSTYDVYFPTVGLHSNVRPAEGDQPRSRVHFRSIIGGLALGRRLDWFSERLTWDAAQRYEDGTNLLTTELTWRRGPIRVLATDFAVMGPDLPHTRGGVESRGQYIKRFQIENGSNEAIRAGFGVFVQAEVNGGIGEPRLGWEDDDRCLHASNRGHGHTNLKLARDATVGFAIAFDDRGHVECEPTGPNEALLLRHVDLPPRGKARVDLLVSGGFTGWRGDEGTFDHWLRPALTWFREANLDQIEQQAGDYWRSFDAATPQPSLPNVGYTEVLSRSVLAAALHFDEEWGAVAAGYDRGLSAYCWPRDAILASLMMIRTGHPDLARALFPWLRAARGGGRGNRFWSHKYTIDGKPEWEAPAIDQTALVPWAVERAVRTTGDLDLARQNWSMVAAAAELCRRPDGHPGLAWLDDLSLITSCGLWETRYAAFLYSNAAAVAGLRAAARLARSIGEDTQRADDWDEAARRIFETGILAESDEYGGPGLVDRRSGRFLEARRLSLQRNFWADDPNRTIDRSAALDISTLALAVPFDLLPASDPRLKRSAMALLQYNAVRGEPVALTRWAADPDSPDASLAPSEAHREDLSGLATLWMARYLIRLGRETGEERSLGQAVLLLDAMIDRLGPLGTRLWPGTRGESSEASPRWLQGVWNLHGMLADTILDLTGLAYDALGPTITLCTSVPPGWTSIGLAHQLPIGRFAYRLERSASGRSHSLSVDASPIRPISLNLVISCPGLPALGAWKAPANQPPPRFDPARGELTSTITIAPCARTLTWSWGDDLPDPATGV